MQLRRKERQISTGRRMWENVFYLANVDTSNAIQAASVSLQPPYNLNDLFDQYGLSLPFAALF